MVLGALAYTDVCRTKMPKIYGGYGVTVNTEVCGTFDQGSIPCSHPKKEKNQCL